MSGSPINPAARIQELERNLRVALASRDAYSDLVTQAELQHDLTLRRVHATQALLREEQQKHAATRQQAREDTEQLHDELENTQRALDITRRLVVLHPPTRSSPIDIPRVFAPYATDHDDALAQAEFAVLSQKK